MKKLAKVILVFTIIIAMIIPMAPVQAATSKTETISLYDESLTYHKLYDGAYSISEQVSSDLRLQWESGVTTVKFTFKSGKIPKSTFDLGVKKAVGDGLLIGRKRIKVLSKKYTKTSYTVKIKIMQSEVDELIEKRIKELDLKNKKYSDAEKLILVTDFIWKGSHYAVDHSNAEKNMIKVLKQQNGGLACEEYAKLLNKFCDKLNIKAYYIVEKIRNHAVSAIELDGVFYLMDITKSFDDNISDKIGTSTIIELGDGFFTKTQIKGGKVATEWTKSLIDVDNKYELGLIPKEGPSEDGAVEVDGVIID